MGSKDGKVRLQLMVTAAILERIDDLASRVPSDRNGIAAWLLEGATSDLEWVMAKVSSKLAGRRRKKAGIPKEVGAFEHGKDRLQVYVNPRVVKRIDELAESAASTRNNMTAWLLDCATSDIEWVSRRLIVRVQGFLNNWRDKNTSES